MACTTLLIIIAERWTPATSYRDLFRLLSERTIGMMLGDSAKPALTTGYGTSSAGPIDAFQEDDWLTGLDGMTVSQESEWLLQELMQGVRNQRHATANPEEFDFAQVFDALAPPAGPVYD
ncbi:hypothetical protein LTR85_007324 [Meristemomyces frigidus]|nr:hypothetical protein LTR85_007324 [Meristemomyces frigidus]